jgi:hypothetical protein
MSVTRSSTEAFADAVAGVVGHHHVGDILGRLVRDCAQVTGAAAVAILVIDQRQRLSLLSATSSATAELEMLQAQESTGPCVDVITSGQSVSVAGAEALASRWDGVGSAVVRTGFEAVDAFPMRWHGRTLGGLNLFHTDAAAAASLDRSLAQAFADVATIVLLHSSDIPADQIAARIHEAIAARGTIEQAKGVLSYTHGLDLEQADRRLREMAETRDRSVSETAQDVVRRAHSSAGEPRP